MFSSFWSKDPSKDFPFDVTDTVQLSDETRSIWTLHRGKRRTNGEPVSIFRFDSSPGKERLFDLAKFGAKKLKSLRHPNILTFIDSLETDKCVIIVTEYVDPVDVYLETINDYTLEQKKGAISWGLLQVAKGLEFLIKNNHNHNNIHCGSIFVTSSCNWKISGLEYVTQLTESGNDEIPNKYLPSLDCYKPPERNRGSKSSTDAYGLGILIWEIFNGPFNNENDIKASGKIPKSLVLLFKELTNSSPNKRISLSEFIEKSQNGRSVFMKNSFIDAMLFLEEIQIKEVNEKNRFFNNLDTNLDNFPADICKTKILPQLITAFEFGNAGAAVLGPLFKIGQQLEDEEYQKRVVPCIVKLFACKDRATRAKLLQQTEQFAKHLSKNIINDQIYPQLAQGFVDSNPTIREQTVKCMLHLASKLSYNNLNEDLLNHFGRLQARDEEGGIRTNTTVCLGKIACHLHPSIRQKVLIPAFLRSMRDPFPPARIAGILALTATQTYYSLKETGTKVMPALCHLTMDPDRSVRDQAFKALKGFISKMEKVSEDPSLAASMEMDLNKAGSETSSALSATWASWAVSSLTSKFYGSKISNASVVTSSSTTSGNISSSNNGSGHTNSSTTSNSNNLGGTSSASMYHEGSSTKESFSFKKSNDNINDEVWGSNGDGWDDQDDPVLPFEDTTNDTSTTNNSSRTSTPVSETPKASASSTGWSFDDPEPEPVERIVKKTQVEVKQLEITREKGNSSSSARRVVKKGPMKLGAKKNID